MGGPLAGNDDQPAAQHQALHAYLLRRFLPPAFADTALADLDLMVVRSWPAGLEREAVSPNTDARKARP